MNNIDEEFSVRAGAQSIITAYVTALFGATALVALVLDSADWFWLLPALIFSALISVISLRFSKNAFIKADVSGLTIAGNYFGSASPVVFKWDEITEVKADSTNAGGFAICSQSSSRFIGLRSFPAGTLGKVVRLVESHSPQAVIQKTVNKYR